MTKQEQTKDYEEIQLEKEIEIIKQEKRKRQLRNKISQAFREFH